MATPDHLTPGMRKALDQRAQIDLEDRPMSAQALRAALRTANIQLGIKDRQIAHLKRQIELLKASAPLAASLAEEEEPSCP